MQTKYPILNKFFRTENKKGLFLYLTNLLKLLTISFVNFSKDDCFMKASGISYTAIVSLVPTLTVALAFVTITSGFNEKQSEIFDTIFTFLQKNDIKIDITPYLETLREIINSATQIGTVGFIVLLFSATAILRTFETSFNQIWGIKQSRPFADKIIFFVFILLIGPLVFIVFFGFASKLADFVRPSHLYSVAKDTDKFIWITGERGTILKLDENGKKIAKLSDFKFDFENMKCFNLFTKKLLQACETPELSKENFIKARIKNNSIYILSQKGILLISNNHGETWNVTDFVDARFRDFGIVNDEIIFFILENGDVYKYKKNESINKVILKSPEVEINATRVRFYNSKLGFILDNKGGIHITTDGGVNFNFQKISNFRLEDIAILNENTFFVVGEKGTIFRSIDGGGSWKDLTHKNVTFTKVWNVEDNGKNYILVLNNFEQILVSKDMGNTWELSYTPTAGGRLLSMTPINPRFGFKALHPDDNSEQGSNETSDAKYVGDILAVGEFSLISVLDITPEKFNWHKISGGDSIFSAYSILNFIFPLIAIWIFFVMLYTLIPNVRVPLSSAVLGSLITSIIFLAFLYGFVVYVRSFSTSTMLIYRALAAVPLFLLYIYGVAIIILLGAEITAVLQYKEHYLSVQNPLELEFSEKHSFYKMVELLFLVFLEQKKARKTITTEKLEKKLKIDSIEFINLLDKLIANKYVLVGKDKEIVPCLLPQDINLFDLYKLFFHESLEVPLEDKTILSQLLADKFHGLEEYLKRELENVNFLFLLEAYNSNKV